MQHNKHLFGPISHMLGKTPFYKNNDLFINVCKTMQHIKRIRMLFLKEMESYFTNLHYFLLHTNQILNNFS